MWGLITSVQAPFYPQEALKRGASMSQVAFLKILSTMKQLFMNIKLILQSGLVFGMVHLSGFITSSAFGIVGHKFNPRNLAFLGSFIQGFAVLIFGILELINEKAIFLSLSFILRNVQNDYD